MDTRRFDSLTKTLINGRLSRRGTLRGLGGSVAAAGLTILGAAGSRAAQDATPDASPAPSGQEPGHDLKVVLHVSDPDGWPPALSNLRNLTAQFSTMPVRVVVDGGGVYVFQGTNDLTADLRRAAQAGVEIQACRNALHEKQIDPSTLPAFVRVVPGGVPALVEAQAQGYRYVKP